MAIGRYENSYFQGEPFSKVMGMKFENEHQAKCHSSVEGAACKATPDTALRQVADEHFKVRFRTFEIGSGI